MVYTQPSDDMDITLFQACSEADLAQVQRLVDLGTDLNHIIGPPGHLNYPMTIAAASGSIPLVRFLLDHGVPVNPVALREAAFRGDLQMTQLLLEPIKHQLASAQTSKRWRWGLSAILKGATERGHPEITQALQIFRSRVNNFDESMNTGLLAAAQAGGLRSVEHFLDMGATDTAGGLAVAAQYKQFEVMQYFLRSFQYESEDLARPLMFTAASGHMPFVLLLINLGAQDDGTAMIKAANSGHFDIAQCLFERFNYTPKTLSRALVPTASAGDVTMMNLLIQKGAQGSSALVPAIHKGHDSATALLLEKCTYSLDELSKAFEAAMFVWLHFQKESVTAETPTRKTSMQQATKSAEEFPIPKMLLARGAKLSNNYYCRLIEAVIVLRHGFGPELLRNRTKYTVLETLPDNYLISLAIYYRSQDVAKLLLEIPILSAGTYESEQSSTKPLTDTIAPPSGRPTPEPIPTPLQSATMIEDESMCKLLIDSHSDKINEWCSYRPNKACTSYYGLHKKTFTPKEEQFEELRFAFGKDAFDDCALSIAIRKENLSIIGLLIENGADPWANKNQTSMLKLAAERNILRYLIACLRGGTSKCGFGANRMEHEGARNVIHYAALYGDADLINELCTRTVRLDVGDARRKTPLHLAVEAGHLEAVKALLWAGASTSVRDLNHFLCPDELALKLLRQTAKDEHKWVERREVSRFLDTWVKNNMDHLDAEDIRKEAELGAENAGGEETQDEEEEWVDHLSDEDSVHWSDDEG